MNKPAANAKWFNIALQIIELDKQNKPLLRDEIAQACDIKDPAKVMEILNIQFAGFFKSKDGIISFIDNELKEAFSEDIGKIQKEMERDSRISPERGK